MTRKIIYSSLLAIVLLSGCSEDDSGGDDTPTEESTAQVETNTQSSTTANQAPTVDAGIDITVIVNEIVTITGSASDSDGTIVNYEWTKDGNILATTFSFSYTPTVVGTDVLKLIVMDDDGESSSDSINVTVKDITKSDTF